MTGRAVVGVVVLNWNQEDLTVDCLDSLAAAKGAELRVVLVDNGSDPASVERLRRRFPAVRLLALGENRGFAGGNNVGIRAALDGGVTHVMLLNNDTLVEPELLPPLLEALELPGVGVVGPKIYHYPDVEHLWFAGGMLDWSSGRQWHLGAGERDRGQCDVARDVDYVTACCLLAPAAVFREVGDLDERYFIYFEETDWNLRAARAGHRRRYVPGARMFHRVSQAMKTGSPISDYYFARNRLLFFRSHAPRGRRAWLIALYSARSLRYAHTLARAGRPASARAVRRGILDFYRGRFGKCPVAFA